MKNILYSILLAGVGLVSCTDFDDPTVEKYGAGPSVSIEVTATSDSAFTFTITPANGTQYYSFVVAPGEAPQQLNAASLLKGNYNGTAGGVLKAASTASYTYDMYSKGAPLCEPNTTYQIYAVAANDKGMTGEIATASATTTDKGIPAAKEYKDDAANKAVAVTFSEAVVRGEGAISAKYYKEWDFANPVVLAENEFTVSIEDNVVTFTAPETPAGAFVAYSWEVGAFKDSYGNDCPAVNSGLNNAGKLVNACVRNAQEAFVIADSNVTAPQIDTSFVDWTEFMGEITLDFDLYRNEKTVKTGDLKVVYTNDSKTTVLNLTPSNWIVQDNKLYFELPEAPQYGDYVSLQIEEGVFTDVYGNPNKAYEIENAWLLSYGYKRDMVVGSYKLYYYSYAEYSKTGQLNEVVEDIAVALDPEDEDGLILSGFYGLSGQVKATFNGDYATVTLKEQALGTTQLPNGTTVIVTIAGNTNDGTLVLDVDNSGNMSCKDNPGALYFAYDENEEYLGLLDGMIDLSFSKQADVAVASLKTKQVSGQSFRIYRSDVKFIK